VESKRTIKESVTLKTTALLFSQTQILCESSEFFTEQISREIIAIAQYICADVLADGVETPEIFKGGR